MDEQSSMVIKLPWPPSVNNYWRHGKNGTYISQKGRDYRVAVFCEVIKLDYPSFESSQRLIVRIDAYPPDKRKRDLDNILKSLLDSLQHAKVYQDDSQIDRLVVERKSALSGIVEVTIAPYQGIASS